MTIISETGAQFTTTPSDKAHARPVNAGPFTHTDRDLMQDSSEDSTENVVRLHRVSRQFGEIQALKAVSLTVRRGEIMGIIGRSGAGKSTLIRCLNGLEQPDSGVIEIEGRAITGLSEKALQAVRSRVGMVFQHFNLLSAKTVEQNVALPLKIAGYDKVRRQARVAKLLALVGLEDKAKNYPAALSGGQKQRVGIARALAANPALLLCDEATSALDPETTRSILALLQSLNQKLGITILLITHEMDVIKKIAHRVAVINGGEIIEKGPVWQVFAHPQSALTRTLLQGLLPQLPQALAERLTPVRKGEAIYSVQYAEQGRQGEILTLMATALPGKFRLIQGGVDHIQHYAVVRFFFSVPVNDVASEQAVLDWLQQRQATVELTGYVSGHD
ncbi:methionine ABC transporter ATP-binding protein [Rahnella aquatilis]|uniref:Cell division ATP-binding protein FtsE n=1 Tax=Rahnella aquatilis (strain ATCC 33071 / DSM 4594 / JCM 1683 / NBRC 105701 / NCIMB 13365 / CIP 78.65) TaxID=745277 RepID=H2ISE4_RAHAC|nr:methionine ABC transporter ATP-binding protein [Rahnella aquatilis]AEX52592.1 ABC-type metal ion transport system, ATPase component [Rahnella aquatilis CIP 78.65 = ATCC 33071]KFD06034.1 ATP-binding component of an ABC superfamily methionine transporter [Rahnella aquatilis CIP 78.65 = ATCC 33071]